MACGQAIGIASCEFENIYRGTPIIKEILRCVYGGLQNIFVPDTRNTTKPFNLPIMKQLNNIAGKEIRI